jgi:ankyrin repeat protein
VSRGAAVATPFLAAAVGHLAAMRRFLESDRAVVNAATPDGDYYGGGATPLHLAAANGHAEIARLLLENGAPVNARGGWFNATPLHWAAQGGWVETAALLLEHGADPAVRDTEYEGTPLDWAEHFEQAQAAELLKQELSRRAKL